MIDTLTQLFHSSVLHAIGVVLAFIGLIHAAVVCSRIVRFVAGQVRDQWRSLAVEINEWRKFLRRP